MDQDCKTLTVPEAGRRYFDLGRNASYEAARRGDIASRVNVEKPVRTGRGARAIVPAGASQLGARQGNHITEQGATSYGGVNLYSRGPGYKPAQGQRACIISSITLGMLCSLELRQRKLAHKSNAITTLQRRRMPTLMVGMNK